MSLAKNHYDINDYRPSARELLKLIRESEESDEHIIDELAYELKKRFDIGYDDFWGTDIGVYVTHCRIDLRDHVLGIVEGFKSEIEDMVCDFNSSLQEAANRAIAEMASRMETEIEQNETKKCGTSGETSEDSGGPGAAS